MAENLDQVKKRRQEKTAQREKENNELDREQTNLKTINDAIPVNQKPQGSAKFGQLILELGLSIFNQIIPSIINTVEDLKIQTTNGVCPSKEKLDQIISIRNRITNKLNTIGNRLDSFNTSLNAQLETYNVTLTLIETIDIASKVTSLASKFIPSPPGVPGVITSTLNDLLTTKLSVLYNTDGSLKLSLLKSIFDSAAMPLTLASGYIKEAIGLLSSLDKLILLCDPFANLINISPSLTNVAKQLVVSDSDGTYKGFTFQIEEVPFGSRLIRKKAIGINKSNIKLIETQLSFTLDNQVLIDELKLIIDKNNLKAN
jgi:hypothetical protein